MGDVSEEDVEEIVAKLREARDRCFEGSDMVERDLLEGEMTWSEARAMVREYLLTYTRETVETLVRGVIRLLVKRAIAKAVADG